MVVKVCWSGGKDSTCAVMKHIEAGDKLKVVCYVPMFDNETPLILKEHYNFILTTAEYFRKLGADVHIVSGMTYFEYVTHIAKSGKNKGKIFGFPLFKRSLCGFKRDSKVKVLKTYDVGYYDYEDIGIAFDEVERHKQLNDKLRSILVEQEITEDQTKIFDESFGILSPHYNYSWNRDGCALCPQASEEERQLWFRDYPDAVDKVIYLQELVKREKPHTTPLRNYKWFID